MRIIDKRFARLVLPPVLALLAFAALSATAPAPWTGDEQKTAAAGVRPPLAEIIPRKLTIHGHTRVDEYYWLSERDNPRVIEYLEAENAYTRAVLEPTEPLREKLYHEIVGRMRQDDRSVPYRLAGYYYYTRYEEGLDYPIHCRRRGGLEAEEEVLLDVNEMAVGYDFYSVAGLTVSPDNTLLAFGVDTLGRRRYTIRFKHLATGEILPDELPLTTGSAAWAADSRTVFFTRIDDTTLRACRIYRHVLGAPPDSVTLVFEESDETFRAHVYASKSKKFLFIASRSTLATEFRFLASDEPAGEFRVFEPRERGHEYRIEHFEDGFFIRTNLEAENFRLMTTTLERTAREHWTEVIPHRREVLLQGFEILAQALVLQERERGLPRIRIVPWDGSAGHDLDFGEETYSARIDMNPEFETQWLRYAYSSLTTPPSIYDYNLATREKKLLKQEQVVGDFDPADYRAERHFATARDGTGVPISLVYRKGLKRDDGNPLLLYGYGSYGASIDPSFRAARLSLLDRGFVYAIAHVRGGQELGRRWYEDGKLLNKMNTFTDFIACAEHLVALEYTSPDRLFATGLSAGGLLMGAVVNMRPELFRGMVIDVPFVDVVTTMLDHSIPLTTSEFDEWGDPREKEYYDYMLSYSPYDNVQARDYPALLVLTGLHDSQVQYFEPAKWVARLRAFKTDDNPLLLWTNMEAGHGGVSGRFRRLEQTALEYAFLLHLAGIKE